jgi:hypothetical protein
MTKTTTITGFTASVVFMFDSDNVVNIEKGAHLMPGGDLSLVGGGSGLFGTILENFSAPDSVHNNVYNVNGQVLGLQAGIVTAGEDDKINIGSAGSIYGSIGIGSLGTHTTITNNGKIIASFAGSGSEAAGILIGGENSKVVNNGFVSGYAGIIAGADGTEIINGKHGVIYGDYAGVGLMGIGSSSADVKFINHGRVTGSSGVAFTSNGLDGNVTIINDGTLRGTVAFGIGNDTFDNRGGSLNKLGVIGGAGDDTLIVDRRRQQAFPQGNGHGRERYGQVDRHLHADRLCRGPGPSRQGQQSWHWQWRRQRDPRQCRQQPSAGHER